MNNTFLVNKTIKSRLHNNYLHSKKGLMVIRYGLIIIMAVFTLVFAYYGFVRSDTFLATDWYDMTSIEKNYPLVWTVLITVNLILIFLWIIQYIVSKHIVTGKNFSQRVNERLSIDGTILEYSYQNAVGAEKGDRVVVRMPLDRMDEIRIDQKLHSIEFTGDYNSAYYENYKKNKTRADVNSFRKDSLVLYDYFSPELTKYVINDLSGTIAIVNKDEE